MRIMKLALCLIAGLAVIYCNCTTGKSKDQTPDIPKTIELVVEKGENWFSKMKLFLFISKRNSPQLAAWIEDDNGNYLSTIAVTEKSAKGNWISAPKEGRPEALPVWTHKQYIFSATNNPDTITSATIKDSFEAGIDRKLLITGNAYNVYFEINHSFDYNDHWTKDNSGVNGQPSLVYHAQFIAGQSGYTSLVPIGYGSVNGSNGNITGELDSLTTALNIVSNVSITVK